MSEPIQTPDAQPAGDGGDGQQQAATYTPPATQADLDRIIAERVNRTKAQFKDYADLKAKASQFDQLQAANQTEAERLQSEATRWQSEADTWRKAAVGSRIEAIAAGSFADPSDAASALADKNYLDAGGQIDEAAIRADLEDVLNRKPHWRKADQPSTPGALPRLPAPNGAQGSSGAGQAANSPADQFAAFIRSQIGTG